MTNDNILEKIFLTELSNISIRISKYDTHSLIIKGWAISLWSGLMYLLIKDSFYFLLIIQVLISIFFWLFDSLYKFYQRRFVVREEGILKFLEDYVICKKDDNLIIKQENNDNKEKSLSLVIKREEISMINSNDFKKLKSLRRCLILRSVSTIYLFLIISSYFIASLIISVENSFVKGFILIFNIIILFFTIINYCYGIDRHINGKKKKSFKIFRVIALSLIIINLFLLSFIIPLIY